VEFRRSSVAVKDVGMQTGWSQRANMEITAGRMKQQAKEAQCCGEKTISTDSERELVAQKISILINGM